MADLTDRKAVMRELYDAASSEEEETPAEVEEVVEEAAAEEEPAAAAAEEEVPAEETPEEKAQRERDEHGRFKAGSKEEKEKPRAAQPVKPKEAPPVEPKPAAIAPVKPAEPVAPATKPPQSWTPAEREQWAKLTPEAQRAVLRTEAETRRVLQESAVLRKEHGQAVQFRNGVEGFVRPFEGIFRAEGVDPIQGMANVVQAYAALHVGSQDQKADIVADLLQRFGVDIDRVNSRLQGQPMPPGGQPAPPPRPAPQVDPRAIVREEFQALQERAVQGRAEREWQAFEATQPEFLRDVWDDMQVILDSAAQRGRNLTPQQAYDRACQMSEEIQSIVQQRKAAEAAAGGSASAPTARIRAAAATVRSRPAPAVGAAPDPNDRRAMLQRAAESSRR